MATILVVDDSRIFRNILETTLTEVGHQVVGSVANGQLALDFLNNAHPLPELVTLDITMPVMEGIETLRSIISLFPGVKVIMVSASGQKGKVMDALKIGALDFIQKPFKPEEINEVIKKYFPLEES
ncbi:MAG: response regulator [Eubacteriales bacterium]